MLTDALNKLFLDALLDVADEATRAEVQAVMTGTDSVLVPVEFLEEEPELEAHKQVSENMYQLVKELGIPGKIKLALFGNKTARSLLIRDTNRQIPMFVLSNARITEHEILDIAKNSNVDDAVLREVGNNSTWMKSYAIKFALVSNPKTPSDMSIRWLKYLQTKDLRRLSKSKNIPQVIATQSRKLLEKRVD